MTFNASTIWFLYVDCLKKRSKLSCRILDKRQTKIKSYLALILLVILAWYSYQLLKSCSSLDFVVIIPEYDIFWRPFSLIFKLILDVLFESSSTSVNISHKVYLSSFYSILSQLIWTLELTVSSTLDSLLFKSISWLSFSSSYLSVSISLALLFQSLASDPLSISVVSKILSL